MLKEAEELRTAVKQEEREHAAWENAEREERGKPSAGPVEKEVEGAAVPGSSLGRTVWREEPREPGWLTGEELMQTLLVEVQGLRRDYDRTSEELKSAQKELVVVAGAED
ncbi:hypothetical protein BN946_scf184841.g4 [Trametes cinnabarina]|uniref:Uncharacterized protein n=1 Tax=Pycnoporus cinnabarinus TaxID=5643 RepID=A0A060SNN5_PYCCI|nr:hypothetical protein BN946_scf184841.g4 [Trametes cinnabarina]